MTLLGWHNDWGGCCAGWCYVTLLLGCPVGGAWCLVCELCRLAVICVDCRCSLSYVFLGGARRLELSPFNTATRPAMYQKREEQDKPPIQGGQRTPIRRMCHCNTTICMTM